MHVPVSTCLVLANACSGFGRRRIKKIISCTEFIPAYSELFKFLERRVGKEGVIRFWKSLGDVYLLDLCKLAKEKGLAGCFEWWNRVLSEEAAEYQLTLDEEQGKFQIVMLRCPSKGELIELEHIEPYHDYCEHCDWLYREVLEPLGFDYEVDLTRCHQAVCTRTVYKKRF